MNLLKLKTGEQQVFDFLQRCDFKVREDNLVSAIGSAREYVRSNGGYKSGLFFKTLFAEMKKSIDWKTAEGLESKFVSGLH